LVEPLLPPWPARSPGPRPVPDRLCPQGILFVLYTGIGWEDLPRELGLRVRDDLLAQATPLDRRRGVRPATPPAAGRGERGGSDRLVTRDRRRRTHPREERGEGTGPSPADPGQARQQASRDHRRCGNTSCRVDHRWHRAGHQQSRRPGRRGTTHRRTTGPDPPTVLRVVGGHGLRQRQVPHRLPAAADRADHPPAGTEAHQGPGAGCATSWNRASPCPTRSAAWPSDGNTTSTSTTHSSASPAPSSAGDA
jgi:hypothetical protein